VRGQVFIVGGAAMALAYSSRRVTKDIDAVFEALPDQSCGHRLPRALGELDEPDPPIVRGRKAGTVSERGRPPGT
jgi:hypothetical protein